jgi:hypothetical protein
MYTIRWYEPTSGYHYAVCSTYASAIRIANALNFEIPGNDIKLYFDGEEREW